MFEAHALEGQATPLAAARAALDEAVVLYVSRIMAGANMPSLAAAWDAYRAAIVALGLAINDSWREAMHPKHVRLFDGCECSGCKTYAALGGPGRI